MAEVFGIAAGAVGVVSLSIQLAESLQKVKGFYASVKNAPVQVTELIEEIEIMQDILSDLEGGSQAVAASSNMKRCIRVARRATKSFATFSEELQASIKKRRYRGSAQFALSRDDIKQMLDQLERTKSSLNLAYSLYQQATAEERHVVVMQALSSSQTSVLQIIQTPQGTLPQQDSFVLTHSKSRLSQHPPTIGKKLFCITTPTWLSNNIWQLEMKRSVGGFNIFARVYGVVPDDAPIFKACANGDIVEMQRLFDSGLASPYDVDEYGRSLWKEAICEARIDSLRFLSQHYNASEEKYSFAAFHHSAVRLWLANRLPCCSGARSLREDLAWVFDVTTESGHDESCGSIEIFHSIALRLLNCPAEIVDSVSFWQAFEGSGIARPLPPFSKEVAQKMLDCFAPEHHSRISPLQLLAVAYAVALSWYQYFSDIYRDFPAESKETEKLAQLTHRLDFLGSTIAIAISSGVSIHKADHCHTPLYLLLSKHLSMLTDFSVSGKGFAPFFMRPWMLRKCLTLWLEILQKAGVDLSTYGAEESQAFERYRSFDDTIPTAYCDLLHVLELDIPDADCLSFTFSYGPAPEDWAAESDTHVEDYVCQFWQMPDFYDDWAMRNMPGRWIED